MGHPLLMISSQISGLLYINGKICTEINANERITVPVSTQGTVYIELSPLVAGYLWLARKLVFVRGQLAPVNDEERKNIYIVEWPGSIYDVDLMPEKMEQNAEQVVASYNNDGWNLRLVNSRESYLYLLDVNGRVQRHNLPITPYDATFMVLHRGDFEQLLITGTCSNNLHYACILSRHGNDPVNVDVMKGTDIEPSDNGSIRVFNAVDDIMHHIKVDTWVPNEGHYVQGNTELMWPNGGPKWPSSPQDTALALMQAIKLDLYGEAAGYISMGVNITPDMITNRVGNYDWCTPLKYALPGGVEPAIGIASLIDTNYAKVRAMRYNMQASGGAQGTWKLVAFLCEGETFGSETA